MLSVQPPLQFHIFHPPEVVMRPMHIPRERKFAENPENCLPSGQGLGNKKNIGGYGLGIPFGKLLTKHCETPVDSSKSS